MSNTNGKFKIEITEANGKETRVCEYNRLTFSAGEVHVQLQFDNIPRHFYERPTELNIKVTCRLKSSEDIMELLMVNDAIENTFRIGFKELVLYYTPFSRQDRVVNLGEALSIKVFGNLINTCKFNRVLTFDNHSSVSDAVINNCFEVSQKTMFDLIFPQGGSNDYFISPDAGANKKTFAIASEFGLEMIQADKKRDLKTGEIKGTVVHASTEDLSGTGVIIVDDICDGGRTVIEIAKILKKKGVREISCFFTHGIFSKGLDVLFDADIDHIYTTNSFKQIDHPKLTILDLNNVS